MTDTQAPPADPDADAGLASVQNTTLSDAAAQPTVVAALPGAAAAIQNLAPAACQALLAQHFPALFGAGRALPLKLRIQADIQARAPGLFNKKSLSIYLHRHTTSTAYLKALSTQPQRIDLDGQPAGEVEAQHREAAAAEVARRQQMIQDRRLLEREQQRAAAQAQRRAEAARHAAEVAARLARAAQQDKAEDQARRDRSALLRAFETATLTKANFCALKGISESDLDAQLALAKQDREQRAQAPQREQRPNGHRPPGPGPRREEHPERPMRHDRGPARARRA